MFIFLITKRIERCPLLAHLTLDLRKIYFIYNQKYIFNETDYFLNLAEYKIVLIQI